MASMGVYIVFLSAIGVAGLPIDRLKLPPDFHAKGFIHELSKQSPNYEKVGQFFKEYYLALNGLKYRDNEFHGNSSLHKREGRGQRWKEPRRREIAKSVNVSIGILTPTPDIIEKSLGYHQEKVLIADHAEHAKVLNRSKKHHSKVDEKISVAMPAVHKNGKTGFRIHSPILGTASFLLWLVIVSFIFYYFCSNKQYKKYFKLKDLKNKEKLKVTRMMLSVPSSAERGRSEQKSSSEGDGSTEDDPRTGSEDSSEEKKKKKKTSNKKKNKKKSGFSVKFASQSSEIPDGTSQSAKSVVLSEKHKQTRQSLNLLKTLFNKVLSSEAIPQRSSAQSGSSVESHGSVIKSDKPPLSQGRYSSEGRERFSFKFAAKDSPIHLDLRRTSPRPIPAAVAAATATSPVAQLVETETHPFYSAAVAAAGNPACRGIDVPPAREDNPRFSTPLIKEDYNLPNEESAATKDDDDDSKKKKRTASAKKCKRKSLKGVDKPLLNEDFKNLHERPSPMTEKEPNKSCLARKMQTRKVTFARVIQVKTYVLKSESDRFDTCFHVFDDGTPWFRVYRKSKIPLNSPANDPLYKFPKGSSSKDGASKDKKQNYSIAILLKQKLKHQKK